MALPVLYLLYWLFLTCCCKVPICVVENLEALLHSLLHQYWQYHSFRPFQEDIIKAVLAGKDVLAVLPTGAGKSLCYQLPAMAKEGLTLVISPLIALMQDQVVQLAERGIAAAAMHSGMSRTQQADLLQAAAEGTLKLLYVAPERLGSLVFQKYVADLPVNLVAVDEAHCISQWGHDFRPAYRRLLLLRQFFPDIPVLAMTASANQRVQQDIIEQLEMKTPFTVLQSVVRENLFYQIQYTENKPGEVMDRFEKERSSSILYCRSRKRCEEMSRLLQQRGLDAAYYHAGLNRVARNFVQQAWTRSAEKIICATSAFGMGVDKPDVRLVAHIDLPEQLEAYYQEAGRAGRDGNQAWSVLFYNHKDILNLQESTARQYPPEPFIRKVYKLLGDFLQMPVGNGFDTLQPFDVLAFCNNFNLELQPGISAIRILEQSGFWQWNQDTQSRTQVRFTTNRSSLEHLERTDRKLSALTTALLRMYGSIFNFLTTVSLYDVATSLHIDKSEVEHGLNQLAAMGFIVYQPALSGSTLYWMHDRLAEQSLVIDTVHIQKLRKIHAERVAGMIDFVTNTTRCRNQLLAAYFSFEEPEPCGGCDVCQQKSGTLTKDLKTQILDMIREERQVSMQALTARFPDTDSSEIIDYIRILSDEELCSVYPSGIIFAT